ncbi:WhiB family transcriptional regulator [Corynebacterium kalidii]
MRTRDTRPWYERAACRGDDPALYETPKNLAHAWARGDLAKVRDGMTAAARCDTCPVIRQCARDALACQDHATIRAGVPVPDKGMNVARFLLRAARAELARVADGLRPFDARATLMATMPAPTPAGAS